MKLLFVVEISARDAIAAGNIVIAIGLIADFPDLVEAKDFEARVPEFGLAIVESSLNSFKNGRIAACGQHAIIRRVAPLSWDKRPRKGSPKKSAGGKKPRREASERSESLNKGR